MVSKGIPLRVLVAEDSEDDCLLLMRELRRGGYEPTYRRVDSSEALQAALDSQGWDIIFCDYTMPGFNGTQALAIVHARALDIPFIFVSGTIGEETAVLAMKAGAHDYVMKGNLHRLLPAVERELQEAGVRERQRLAEAERSRLLAILEATTDFVSIADRDGLPTYLNRGGRRLIGLGEDESLPRAPIIEYYPESARARIADEALPAAAASGVWQGESALRARDGREIPVSLVILAHRTPDGSVEFFSIIARDISGRKRAEQEMHLLETIAWAATEAGDMHAALTVALGKVCQTTQWALAQAWVPRSDGTAIECSPAWHAREEGMAGFRTASLGFTYAPGEGLPGSVWASKGPVWIRDVTKEPNFARAAFAREAGLTAAMGLPVLAGETVVAVLEFFVREPREEDGRLIELVSAVAAQLGTVIQRKRAEERLHHLVHHDALTALPNRVLLNERLEQAIVEANRHQRLVGVAFLNLDRFKIINESLGHGVGDLLLRSVGERIARCLRDGDTVARIGGDSFAVILADMGHADDAARVADKILDAFTLPFHIAGRELFASASLGVSLYPVDDDAAEDLLRNADIALYRAKESGGNTYQFFAADMAAKTHERLAIENALRLGFERSEFRLHYQPVVELTSGRIVGLEALLRWQHPERGLVPPAEFIPLAEETGLIVRLGEWALHAACEQWRPSHAQTPVRVAVNVSFRQMRQPDLLVEMVVAILKRTGFDPAFLELELTETLLMQNADIALAAMHKLNAVGVRFSVDDFGTGYSSLAYLKRLPVHNLKIDRSFLRDIPGNENDASIIRAIISMAHALDLQPIAEGVETREQLEFLRTEGCDFVQGYYFSPPRPAEEIIPMLNEQPWLSSSGC